MAANELLIDGFGRIREIVHDVLDGLTADDLAYRAGSGGQLDRLADLAPDPGPGRPHRRSRRSRAGLADRRLGEAVRPAAGSGRHRLRPRLRPGGGRSGCRAELLAAYHDATSEQTIEFVSELTEADCARSSTGAGIRRSRWPSAWSACCPMTSSTRARPRSSAACSSAAADAACPRGRSGPAARAATPRPAHGPGPEIVEFHKD